MSWYDGLLDAAQGAATTALAATGPLGAVAAAAINTFLDDDEKVTPETTVEEYKVKLDKLPPEAQAEVGKAYYSYMSDKEKYGAEVANTTTTSNMQVSLAREVTDRDKNAVRPTVVKWAAGSLFLVTTIIALALAGRSLYYNEQIDWQTILVIMGTQAFVIREYMSRRSQDKVTAVHADLGQPVPQPKGIIQTILGR